MSENSLQLARVREAAESLGLSVHPRIMPDTTRTAEEAAAACGCSVAEIVKSLVFRGAVSGTAVLLLVSGKNRVDEARVGLIIGEAIERPNAAFVRAATGFAIGGIPPLGHRTPLPTYIDEDLLAFPRVFAAAGTPHALFDIDPKALADALGAHVIAMR